MIVGVALAVVLLALSVALGLIWRLQERIVFQPCGPPYPHGEGTRRVEYRAEDGQPLFALVVESERATTAGRSVAPGVVLAFHGNADLAAWMVPWARVLACRTGWTIVLPEYRGYGGLPGPPTTDGTRCDARAVLRWGCEALHIPPGRLALYGHSLGSAIATELASELASELAADRSASSLSASLPSRPERPVPRAERPAPLPRAPSVLPDALILEAPFTSARAMARRITVLPVDWVWHLISRVHYDTEARVRALDTPVWVAHGEQDRVVPPWMGDAVFTAARRPGELLRVPGAGHSDVAEVAGERYWEWLERALTSPLSPAAAAPP